MYWCWETWEDIWRVNLFFPGFYKYGKNTGLSRLKTGSRKYERDTPLPASRTISVFFRKYGNRRDKYRNTDGTGRDFVCPFSTLTMDTYSISNLMKLNWCLWELEKFELRKNDMLYDFRIIFAYTNSWSLRCQVTTLEKFNEDTYRGDTKKINEARKSGKNSNKT